MGQTKNSSSRIERPYAPATSVEGREQQLMSLAIDVAEEQLLNRTASSAVIVHFLKLSTTRAELEKERLRKENLLLEAKTESIKNSAKTEELYVQALNAMRSYNGGSAEEEEPE